MGKTVIAVDIDDVLADSTNSLRLEVNRRLQVNLTKDDYRIPGEYHSYYERVWERHGLAGRITMEQLDPQMRADQSHVLPHAHTMAVLQYLKTRYELIIITGRSTTWEAATRQWLNRYFPGIFTQVLFGGGHEGLCRKSKAALCLENGVSWLIDDNVEHAQLAAAAGIKVILFGDYGWHHHAPSDMAKCQDWLAVKELLDGKR